MARTMTLRRDMLEVYRRQVKNLLTGLYLAAFAVSVLIPQEPLPSFLSGFVALFLLWGLLALSIDLANNSILSAKIAAILFLGGSSIALICVTGFVAALVGGGGAITGAFLKKPQTRQPE